MLHLSASELKQLVQMLDQSESQIRAQLGIDGIPYQTQAFSEIVGDVMDSGDQASADLINGIEHALDEKYMLALQEIGEAKVRIQKQRYGLCFNCEQGIEFERLLAYPTAKRCIVCQQLYEKNKHVTGLNTL